MELNTLLFDYIKKGEYIKIIKLLDNNNNIDVNIRDDSNSYLIQYAIMFNQIEIIKKLLNMGCKLDFIDIDGYSILHHPIRHKYNDIIKLLLLLDINTIGIPLKDIVDKNGSIPLYYAVEYNNIDAFKLLLDVGSNVNKLNNSGESIMHYVVRKDKIDMVNLLLENNKLNINLQNKIGETPLHVACNYENIQIVNKILEKNDTVVDLYDYEQHATSLMYVVTLRNIQLVKILLKHKAKPYIQDALGNTSLHMSILEDNPEIANILIDNMNDFDLVNIESMTPLHLLLSKHTNINILNKYKIDVLINKTNLNIQNMNGDTIWHILAHELWKDFYSLLRYKKNNVFIKNVDGIIPYDIVKEDDKNNFINLIIDSYYNALMTDDYEYINMIDNNCALKKKSYNECKKLIYDLITKNNISIPQKKSLYCNIEIDIGKNVSISTYMGFPIDIICGIVLLQQKYNNIMVSSLFNKLLVNNKLYEYNKQMGIYKTNIDFLNFEIMWIYQSLFYPENFDNVIKIYIKSKKRYFIVPLGIEIGGHNVGHANILIYDKIQNTMERFEPNGSTMPPNYNYNDTLLDNKLKLYFSAYFKNMKYLSPNDFLPKIGLQAYENREYYITRKIKDPSGFCGAWCVWYVDNKLKYNKHNILSNKLIKYLIRKINYEHISYKNIIRNYTKNITDIRDGFLTTQKLNIDDYYNNQYTEKQIKNIENEIHTLIGYK